MNDILIGNEKNILFYNDEELEEKSTCAIFAQVKKRRKLKCKKSLSIL